MAGIDARNSAHVSQDICTYSHGGFGNSMDKSLEHANLVVQLLSDIYTRYHCCHPSDYVAKSSQLATTFNVTSGSYATPTEIVAVSIRGGRSY